LSKENGEIIDNDNAAAAAEGGAFGGGGGGGLSTRSPFPIVLSAPINGRITSLEAFQLDSKPTSLLFLTTDQHQYAVIGYNPSMQPHYIQTYASGSLKDEWNMLGTLAECGPLVTVDPHSRCIVLHLYDGLISVFPIMNGRSTNMIGPVFHARLEERTLLSMTILHHTDPLNTYPHLCLLHQDSRGAQHITTHVLDLRKSQLISQVQAQQYPQQTFEWLKKPRIDGGSSLLIPVPPRQAAAAAATSESTNMNPKQNNVSGGVVVLGQRQITFCALNHFKVMPIPPALILSWGALPPDISGMPRFLLGDEFGNLHMLTLITQDAKVVALQLDTLGSCTLSSSLQYLDHGLVFCGSTLGDSQLVQIHDEPIPVDEEDLDDGDAALELGDTTYLSVVEEYTHLGPIVDFDLVPMAGSTGATGGPTGRNSATNNFGQSQVVTASGSSKSGSLRVIRNGIGMKEYASVELSGIQNMWSLRAKYDDTRDSYLVQSFVGETRVLGVVSAEQGQDETTMEVEDGKPTGADGDVVMQGDDNEEESEVGGTLEEVFLPGLQSNASTLYIGNVVGTNFLQVTETEIRLASIDGAVLDTITPESNMTVAAGNEAGQVIVALRGGKVLYFEVENSKLVKCSERQMDREVSCLDINPFKPKDNTKSMDTSGESDKVAANTSTRKTHTATLCVVGLWDDFTVRLLSLESKDLMEVLQIHLSTEDEETDTVDGGAQGQRRNRNNMMARSLCLITLDFSSSSASGSSSFLSGSSTTTNANSQASAPGVNMLLVGLGDGTLVSFAVVDDGRVRVQSKKEVSLGTQRVNLIPLNNERGSSCVLATGDRPTVIYLAGMGGTSGKANYNPKLCYSNVNLSPADEGDGSDVSRPHSHESIAVNVAAPFFSPLLFDDMGNEHYSLCVADDANLRLGVIDDIQKLHVTTCRLGMAPRRIVHCPEGRMFAVGCIESGIKELGVDGGDMAMSNCIRFLDDSTFDDIHRIDMEPAEMILSMVAATLRVHQPTGSASSPIAAPGDVESGVDQESNVNTFLIVGTAYVLHDEDEPTKGRILVYSCIPEDNNAIGSSSRSIKLVTELQVRGGVYSMCQFYDGKILVTVNSKTQLCQMVDDGTGVFKLSMIGVGHHGHILSLFVASRAPKLLASPIQTDESASNVGNEKKPESSQKEMLAIVGDLMRSISLVQYYPQHETLEEVARDFNANWTTAVAMLTEDIYLGGENWNNLYVLKRNIKAQNEEVRCRLDTVGEFHLGEMCNKFMSGSLVMPSTSSNDPSKGNASQNRRRTIASPSKKPASKKVTASPGRSTRSKKPVVTVGSQTLFGTVDGTLGVILGLDSATAAFFSCLEKSMETVIMPIGNFSHKQFRAFNAEQRRHPSHGFVDGDLVESFLDLDKSTMELVVQQMNKDGAWDTTNSTFTGGEEKSSDAVDIDDGNRLELSVDDVLAVVEEMTMLH
jgi:DNA damage-binding protein 1